MSESQLQFVSRTLSELWEGGREGVWEGGRERGGESVGGGGGYEGDSCSLLSLTLERVVTVASSLVVSWASPSLFSS